MQTEPLITTEEITTTVSKNWETGFKLEVTT